MSLTLEYIGSASLQTYLSAVQKQRLAKAHATVRDLGILQTPSGKVHLALIEESNHLGPLQILQGITLYEQYAIIYTAVALKKDFPSLQTDILESLRSLRSFPSVLEAIQDSKKKQWLSNRLEKIQEMHKKYSQKSEESLSFNSLFQENCWSSFSEEFLAEFAHKEPYWLFAALREIKNQLTESPLK